MREREGEERARLDSAPGQLHIVADRRDPAERAAAALRGRGAPGRSPRLEPHRPIARAAEPRALRLGPEPTAPPARRPRSSRRPRRTAAHGRLQVEAEREGVSAPGAGSPRRAAGRAGGGSLSPARLCVEEEGGDRRGEESGGGEGGMTRATCGGHLPSL